MTNLARYHAANLPDLFDKITKNSIGMDEYLNNFFNSDFPQSNYPPYNLIQLNIMNRNSKSPLRGSRKMNLKSIRSLENYMSKARKKQQKLMENLSIKDWPNVPLNESGRSPMIRRLDPSSLKMDY